jgi:glutathionylspermidine synthase
MHEALIAALADIGRHHQAARLHLACDTASTEDRGFIAYLADCAIQAGLKTTQLDMRDIGSNGRGPFVDLAGAPIPMMFKLYPWEWMFEEDFIRLPSMQHTRFIEPPWRAILSNKGILPLLWEMAPGHPNLLESYFADAPEAANLGSSVAHKPLHSREGNNVSLRGDSGIIEAAGGPYDDSRAVLQALAPLRRFDGHTAIIGSWIVAGKACGIGIREDTQRITRNASRFVPHVILN